MLDGARAVGLGMALLGVTAVALASRLGEGTETGGPGTRFLPVLLGAFLALLGAVVAWRPGPPGGGQAEPVAPGGRARAAWTLATVIGYVLVLERLGFLLATAPFLVVLLLAYGEWRWPVVASVALAATAATYALFAVWLNVPLPSGLLGR
jgi:hypothetical protein